VLSYILVCSERLGTAGYRLLVLLPGRVARVPITQDNTTRTNVDILYCKGGSNSRFCYLSGRKYETSWWRSHCDVVAIDAYKLKTIKDYYYRCCCCYYYLYY